MTPGVRLAIGAMVVALGFSGGAAVGHVAGPLPAPGRPAPPPTAGAHDPARHAAVATGTHHSLDMGTPGGLLASQSGYTLDVPRTVVGGVEGEVLPFRIVGPDGAAVQRFALRHERYLHLVVVTRDLATYHHLHPSLDPSGVWTVALPALAPGPYHAFASFAAEDGPDLTLSVNLLVPGHADFAPLPETGPVVDVDGYQVSLIGAPMAAADTTVTLRVTLGGAPVTDLTPYLGALGHLVALRSGDLAYTHVHPVDVSDVAGGPEVRFMLRLHSRGDYRLFFDFAHGGGVHTAALTVHVPGDTP